MDKSEKDKLRRAQKARASKYGIEALVGAGESLTPPKGYPTNEAAFADPVNLKYPLEPEGRLRAARGRFKQNASVYKKTSSKRIVHERIVRAMLAAKIVASYDAADALDRLLPEDLKRRMQGSKKRSLVFSITRAYEKPVERAAGAPDTVPAEVEWWFEGIAATDQFVLTRYFPGVPADVLEKPALAHIARDLKQNTTVFLNHDLEFDVGNLRHVELQEDGGSIFVRGIISKARPEVWTRMLDKTLNKLSVHFLPLETKEEWDDSIGKVKLRIMDALGVEVSIAGAAMDWACPITAVGARSADGSEYDFTMALCEMLFPAFDDEGRLRFAAQIHFDEAAEPKALQKFARAIVGHPILRDGKTPVAKATAAHVMGKSVNVYVRADAPGALAPSDLSDGNQLQFLGITRRKAGQLVGLELDTIEIAKGEAPAVESEDPMNRKELVESIKRKLAEIGKIDDADKKDALKAEVSDLYEQIELQQGEQIPHPLQRGLADWLPDEPAAPAKPAAPVQPVVAAPVAPAAAPAEKPLGGIFEDLKRSIPEEQKAKAEPLIAQLFELLCPSPVASLERKFVEMKAEFDKQRAEEKATYERKYTELQTEVQKLRGHNPGPRGAGGEGGAFNRIPSAGGDDPDSEEQTLIDKWN